MTPSEDPLESGDAVTSDGPRWVKWLGLISGVGILLLCTLTLWDVSSRTLTGQSVPGGIEFTEVGLVIFAYLGMLAAQLGDRHIRTPIITNRLPSAVAYTCRIIAFTLAVLVAGWVTYSTALTAIESVMINEYRHGLIHVPIWPARIAVPVGMASLTIALSVTTVDLIRRFVRGEPAKKTSYEIMAD